MLLSTEACLFYQPSTEEKERADHKMLPTYMKGSIALLLWTCVSQHAFCPLAQTLGMQAVAVIWQGSPLCLS